MGKKRKRRLLLIGAALLGLYVGSYAVLSRAGYVEADRLGIEGFYYFPPEDTGGWRFRNYACACLFWPMNAADRWLGSGRHPAFEPLRELGAQPATAADRGSRQPLAGTESH
ncbi:MAG TPA: hypothetical protein VNC50_21990 [Planctomycetia bacterium]|nr:hypothetical protein [Planctomycetia bacterium]